MPARIELTDEQRAELIRLYHSGLGIRDAGAPFRLCFRTCRQELLAAGVALKPRGGRKPYKLTHAPGETAEIVAAYRARVSAEEIGRRRNVSGATICAALRRAGVRLRCRSDARRQLPLNEAAFDDPTDPDAQYWAGFLMADGNVTSNHRWPIVSLSLAEADRAHVEKFRAFVGSGHKVMRLWRRAHRRKCGTAVRGGWMARLSLPSRPLANVLARYGVVPRKTECARARLRVLLDSPSFWHGVVDGDGWLGVYVAAGREVIVLGACGSAYLMRQFARFVNRNVADRNSDAHARNRRETKNLWEVRLCGRVAWHTIRLLYGHGGVSLDRKQARADYILSRPDLCPGVRPWRWPSGLPGFSGAYKAG